MITKFKIIYLMLFWFQGFAAADLYDANKEAQKQAYSENTLIIRNNHDNPNPHKKNRYALKFYKNFHNSKNMEECCKPCLREGNSFEFCFNKCDVGPENTGCLNVCLGENNSTHYCQATCKGANGSTSCYRTCLNQDYDFKYCRGTCD